MKRPKKNKEECPYCGDAPESHAFLYAGGLISMALDPLFKKTSSLIPRFAIAGAEGILAGLFHLSRLLGAIRLSDDPERSVTLRSKVIWEEARRRGIEMRQMIVFGKPTDNFRTKINDKYFYFDSLPVPPRPFFSEENWDDKFFLKKIFSGEGIPVPRSAVVPFSKREREVIFGGFSKPIVVKPRVGSRGRHTTAGIRSLSEFEKAVRLARRISPQAVMEEELSGYVCRATCVAGRLAGFYRAEGPKIAGDGQKTIRELIIEKNNRRPGRVEKIEVGFEIEDYLSRLGFRMEDILPEGKEIRLSHRTGRLFGGATREMLDDLHPSFFPILEKAAKVTGLPVVGFDCIIPDPEASENSQRWGIIEGNTLPFIDLHYYALSGKPRNIAGMIWDLWQR